MIQEYPLYYTKFKCVGGTCPDSCCAGWELDIDEDTYEYYKSVEGSFGDRLRAMMNGEDNSFVLQDNGRCPFFNNDNLCDIYIELGELSLCNVCTEYPRNHEIIGDYEQTDVGMSCPEVSRLIFEDTDRISYKRRKVKEISGERLSLTDQKKTETLIYIRDCLIEFMQNDIVADSKTSETKFVSWQDKMRIVMHFMDRLQTLWNESDYNKIRKLCRQIKKCKVSVISDDMGYGINNEDSVSVTDFMGIDIIKTLEGIEVLDSEWMDEVKSFFKLYNENQWDRFNSGLKKSDSDTGNETGYDRWHCKIISYFLFRYVIRAYYDNNISSKIKFALFSAKAIHCLDYVRWINNNYKFSVTDRIEVAWKYAKEIEHSEDNMEFLFEEFLFS